MADGSLSLDFGQELVVELFAGAGGASFGLTEAYRAPDVAVNHDPVAIAVHRINHPTTKHYTCDVFEVDPIEATGRRPVGVLWASPDCRHHSKAKGGKPRSKRVRGLAWVVVRWAAACRPRIIHLENVEEFADWGPLLPNGQPCPRRRGTTFQRWKRQLEKLGYQVEYREIVAADHDAPTTRNRLYVIARCDGRPIVWPAATNAKDGKGGLKPWRAAAECIDWSLPACSIFADKAEAAAWAKQLGMKGRPKRPLERATKRRVAKGLWRYTIAHPSPFVVPLRGSATDHHAARDIDDPLSTVSAGGTHHALIQPFLARNLHQNHGSSVDAPMPTLLTGNHTLLTAAHMVKFRGESVGTDAAQPVPTITAGGALKRDAGGSHKLAVATAHLVHLTHQDGRDGYRADEPARTVTGANRGEQAVVCAHLTEFANASNQRTFAADEPLRTQVAQVKGGHFALASAHLAQAAGGPNSNSSRPRDAREPLSTVTAKGCQQQLVTAYLVKSYSSGGQWSGADRPLGAITTKDRMGLVRVVQVPADIIDPALLPRARQVAAFLHEYLPERFPEPADLVLIGDYVMVDITLRMLTPRELARAQGFPDSYVIEFGLFELDDGTLERRPITKTAQVRLIGNSVCPPVARALARANAADLINLYRRIAA